MLFFTAPASGNDDVSNLDKHRSLSFDDVSQLTDVGSNSSEHTSADKITRTVAIRKFDIRKREVMDEDVKIASG
jgi:hypothetical protein